MVWLHSYYKAISANTTYNKNSLSGRVFTIIITTLAQYCFRRAMAYATEERIGLVTVLPYLTLACQFMSLQIPQASKTDAFILANTRHTSGKDKLASDRVS